MKFNIKMDDKTIRQAAALVERHYDDYKFLDLVSNSTSFNYTKDRGFVVADKIFNGIIGMNIVPYKTWSPWSKVIGYAKGNTIYVNTRKLDLPLKDRVENFMHEPLHLLGYSHKGNSNNEFNRNTVPYRVASVFVKYLESIGKL